MASGESEHTITVDGQDVLVVRSRRRTRTVSADQVQGQLRLRVPHRLGSREVASHARSFQRRLSRRTSGHLAGDAELMSRALSLSRRYLQGEPQPTSVTWSGNQTRRWGSTTSTTGTIRLSSRLRDMPGWVVDAVLVHELAHLIEPGHGAAFRALVNAYPRTSEADAFLAGVSWADSAAQPGPA